MGKGRMRRVAVWDGLLPRAVHVVKLYTQKLEIPRKDCRPK